MFQLPGPPFPDLPSPRHPGAILYVLRSLFSPAWFAPAHSAEKMERPADGNCPLPPAVSKGRDPMSEFYNSDARLSDCGHPRKLHAKSVSGRLLCLYRDAKDVPCPCCHFTITVSPVTPRLPGRLTEKNIVVRAAKKGALR